jgi:hypothetical protein
MRWRSHGANAIAPHQEAASMDRRQTITIIALAVVIVVVIIYAVT